MSEDEKRELRLATPVYISGPMSGFEDWNFPAFREAADELRRRGYPVVNPADFGAKPCESWEDCLKRDLAVMSYCSGVVLLPGWGGSRGARLEEQTAKALGMPTIELYEAVGRASQGRDIFGRW